MDAGPELTPRSWENRLTGRILNLNDGIELTIDVGETPTVARRVLLHVVGSPIRSDTADRAVIALQSDAPALAVTMTYEVDRRQPEVMHKYASIRNTGKETVRILNASLGRYPLQDVAKIEPGERGFPLYIDGQYFMSLAHPAGFADASGQTAQLHHYPGVYVAPGESFRCAEAVYGVGATNGARATFVDQIRSRMRRISRHHDQPIAMIEAFGGQPNGEYWTRADYIASHLDKVAEGKQQTRNLFDIYCMEFWHDRKGDLTRFDPTNFPQGFTPLRNRMLALGMSPGLWIDSGGLPDWTAKDNPAVANAFSVGPGQGILCRADPALNAFYLKAFTRQVKENHVRVLKFDNLGPDCKPPVCNNPKHAHLPGPLYSTEAIDDGAISFLKSLDAECPEAFFMLYWGYHSPWWLLYADTYFESGSHIEAASPAEYPAPFARDAVTQRLDQAQWLVRDTPWIGKDSLGVWLSAWPWNSGIGKARWQEAFVMDMGRGNLLAQIWTDTNWLSPPEREQLATFVSLLKAQPECFSNARIAFGDPTKSGSYAYTCSDGKRTFVTVHNACLDDSLVPLSLGPEIGLPSGGGWDIYRWHPRPAKLARPDGGFTAKAALVMRPYEAALLEIVPTGQPASLGRDFKRSPASEFSEPTRTIPLVAAAPATRRAATEPSIWSVLEPQSATSACGATLTTQPDHSVLASGTLTSPDTYTITARTNQPNITGALLELLRDDSLPGHGPGRAVNGNFALAEFRVSAAPVGRPDERIPLKLRAVKATFSQISYGGFPAEASIDNRPETAWSIHPYEGLSHAAVFQFERPTSFVGGTLLTFELHSGDRGHSLGRLRLSSTANADPLQLPDDYAHVIQPTRLAATLPSTIAGGILLIVGEKSSAIDKVTIAGEPIITTPVWSDRSNWRCNWQAWRLPVMPSSKPSELRVDVTPDSSDARAADSWRAHFIPAD